MTARVGEFPSRGILSYFRFRPLGAGAEHDRSRERFRRATLATLSAVLGKLVSMASILISVPLTLHYLGPERYGLWMTISSLVMLLSFGDLGLGIGLMNSIAHAHGKEDQEDVRVSISNVFFMLLGICGLALVAISASVRIVPWAVLLNVSSSQAAAESAPSVLALVACLAIGLPLGIVQRVQLGYQEGGLSNLWNCLGGVIGLLSLLLAIHWNAGLPWLIVASTGMPLLAQAINHLIYFGIVKPELRPRWSLVQIGRTRLLLRLGMGFFILHIGYLLSYSTDNYIVSLTLGNDSVATYSVCVKYFSLSLILVQIANASLWTAYGEAFARGDRGWVKRTFWRAFWGSLLVSGGLTVVLVAISATAMRLWVGQASVPGLSLICGVGVWGVLDTVRVTTSTFFNALNLIRFQTIVFFSFVAIGITTKLLSARFFGLEGLVWGGIGAYVVVMLFPMLLYASRVLADPGGDSRSGIDGDDRDQGQLACLSSSIS